MRQGLVLLTLALIAATSDGFLQKGRPREVSAKAQLVDSVKTAAHDLQRSVLLKKKALVGTATALADAKLSAVHGIKDTKANFLQNLISAKLAQLARIKETKLGLLKSFFASVSPYASSGNSASHKHQILSPLFSHVFSKFSRFPKETPRNEPKLSDVKYVLLPLPREPTIDVRSYERKEIPVFVEHVTRTRTESPLKHHTSGKPASVYGPPRQPNSVHLPKTYGVPEN